MWVAGSRCDGNCVIRRRLRRARVGRGESRSRDCDSTRRHRPTFGPSSTVALAIVASQPHSRADTVPCFARRATKVAGRRMVMVSGPVVSMRARADMRRTKIPSCSAQPCRPLRVHSVTLSMALQTSNRRRLWFPAVPLASRRQRIDIDDVLHDVLALLPDANPNDDFRAALRRLHPKSGSDS